ncbi:MAG TPA: DPP IV N-terminal domain-containing protein, partial [Candidatus Limnocylindria bacterium]|nr:DPP IV N-terminal domain-containing protein [Candidatus Limnocylindria bacterium]
MPAPLTLASLGQLPLPGTDIPAAITFTPDGGALTYLQSTDGSLVRSLWWHDLASGERHVILGPQPGTEHETTLGHEEHLRRERTRTSELGVTEFAWASHAIRPTLVVPVGGQVFIGIGSRAADGLAPLPGVEDASVALLAPDGLHVAVVREGDLWVAPLGCDGPMRRLTSDAGPGVFNGLAEFVAAEELGRYEGMWWSRTGRHLAVAHVDERHLPSFTIAHLGANAPGHEEHRYPFAGGPNAHVTLRILPIDGGPPMEVDLGAAEDDYLARVVPEIAGGWLVAVLPRAQRSLRWLRVETNGSARELWVERSEPWLNVDAHTRALDSGTILRSSERTGFRHLELRAADGALLRQLTAGEWMVTDVVHVDEERGEVLFVGTADGPTQRHLYAASLDGSEPQRAPQRLTAADGWHAAVASHDGSRWVDTWSSLGHAPSVTVNDRDGGAPIAIHASSGTAADFGRRPPELRSVTAADGATRLDAALYRPANPASTPPPCVVWVYGGPHAQYVKDAWELTVHPLRQYLAQAGVAVLVVDNRGSAFRGLAFEAPLAGHLGGVEVEDQCAAVEQLAAAGEIDGSRVAITGGSYGGFMTLRSVIRRPDVFRCGVAIAPVTDQRGYDTGYVERYLGHPADQSDAYDRSSVLPHAAGLNGSVLVIHGAIDENVHLRHSIRLAAAVQAAGRDLDLVILPDDRHRVRTPDGLLTRDRRTVRHLLQRLG